MDLETLNKEYVQFKSDLEQARVEIENLETKANSLVEDKIIWKGKLVEAKRNGDKNLEQTAEKELEKIDKELNKIQDETLKKKEDMKMLQAKINVKMIEIKENPEMKKHLEQVMAKKYNRKISKLEQEKEEIVEKKDRLMVLKQIITEHQSLENNLKGILVAQEEIKGLKEELDSLTTQVGSGLITYTDPARAKEIKDKLIPQAESKFTKNKTPLMAYIAKNSLDITEKDIIELTNKGLSIDGKGNIDINATMNKNISSLNRQIKGYDKSIKNNTIALNKIGIGNISQQQTPIQQQDPQQVSYQQQNLQQTPNEQQTSFTQNKPKWYQFVQRFKNWNERRRQQALPEPEVPSVPTPVTPINQTQYDDKNEFRDSLKYEVVQDVVKQMQEEDLKQAKKERKTEDMER